MTTLDSDPSPLATGLCPPPERSVDCTLDALTRKLEPLLRADGRERARTSGGAEVAALLRAYASCEKSWRGYANFREDTYSRNLIWRCGDFELLLLCWNANQCSPIHDHAGQHCWMAVLEGHLEEVHFSGSKGEEPVQEGRVMAYPAGKVAYIHDDIALHLIRPAGGRRAVSLHLYSNPIDACRIFCPETGEPSSIRVGYHTVRGQSAEGADAEAIRRAWDPA